MVKFMKSVFAAVLFLIFTTSFAYCQMVSMGELLGKYNGATEVQKQEIIDTYKYKKIAVSGILEDAADWASFDERSDKPGNYYKVTLQPQKLDAENYYQISIFYKDKSSVKPLDKGAEIASSGDLVKIIDEPGLLSIWVYADDLTPEDKVMFDAYL